MVAAVVDWGTDERHLGAAVSALVGAKNGAYPAVNSLLVRGAGETVVIDPGVTVVERGGAPAPIDAVINSHSHEDHLAGNGLFDQARVHIHHDDLRGAQSLDGLMEVYGLPEDARRTFETKIVEEFYYSPRPDAEGFTDGHLFDLGGVTVEAVHLPGHTRGHSGFRVDGVFYLSDIDLTGFGPYYGDAWSDLDDFVESLAVVRGEDARHYVTSHHKGIIDDRATFIDMVDSFRAVIDRRDTEMRLFLAEPRTITEMADRRFIYRPHVELPFAESVERRSAELHVERMVRRGEATEVEPGRFQAT
ncbi:MAG: MBL fold metallo-hydrolase [Actinomycetota bacterium]